MSRLVFSEKLKKNNKKLLSAAVVIGALRVNHVDLSISLIHKITGSVINNVDRDQTA